MARVVSKILDFIDRLGARTIDSAELLQRRLKELAIVRKEQEEAAKILDERRRELEEERFRRIKRLIEVEESILEEAKEEEEVEREELKVPFSERFMSTISDIFSKYTTKASGFFRGLQEDLYRAHIDVPVKKYIAFALGVSTILAVTVGVVGTLLFVKFLGIFGITIGLPIAFLTFIFSMFFARMYPKNKVKARRDAFARELPFALRHMATKLAGGSGLFEAMNSVAKGGYGVLSEEFRRVLLEVERGSSIEDALERMDMRIGSPALRKVIRHIISTIRTGGNIANTLKMLAEEISTEVRMKIKDFIQVLNTFTMMYMFLVVVAPVMLTVLVIALGISQKAVIISPTHMWIIYLAIFMVSLYFTIVIKKFEPKA